MAPTPVYLTVEVSGVNVPVFTKGVPEPGSVHVLLPASSSWVAAIVSDPLDVIVLLAVEGVLALSEPLPNVRLLNVHALVPPKLPAEDNKNVPPVRLIVPLPVTSPPLTVISLVPERVPRVIIRSLPITVESEKLQPPKALLKVTLYQSEPPSVMMLPASAALNVTVDRPEVNVPELVQLPETLILAFPVAAQARVPDMAASWVVKVSVPDIVRVLLDSMLIWLSVIKGFAATVRVSEATKCMMLMLSL